MIVELTGSIGGRGEGDGVTVLCGGEQQEAGEWCGNVQQDADVWCNGAMVQCGRV